MPWLTSCCCGFSVRSGTKAVAILSLIYSVFGLLAVGTFNYGKEMLHRERMGINQSRRPTGFQEIKMPPGRELVVPDEETDLEKIKKIEELMMLYAVSVSVNFLVSLSLLLGLKMEKRWLLLPWIVWTALNLVVSQAVVLYAPDKRTSTIPDIFSTAIMVYCMLCVISYYQTLSSPSSSGSGRPPPPFPSNQSPDAHCASFPGCNPDLTVALPPTPPPAYPADNPPLYDPPPPYPGFSPSEEKGLVVRCENENQAYATTVPPYEPPAPPPPPSAASPTPSTPSPPALTTTPTEEPPATTPTTPCENVASKI